MLCKCSCYLYCIKKNNSLGSVISQLSQKFPLVHIGLYLWNDLSIQSWLFSSWKPKVAFTWHKILISLPVSATLLLLCLILKNKTIFFMLTVRGVEVLSDTLAETHNTSKHFLLKKKNKKEKYMNTVSRKPHFGHPTRHFISFERSGGAQPFPAAHHYECMSMRCKWQGCFVRRAHSGRATWHHWMGCRGLSGGKQRNTHKEALRERGRGARLAPVLLPFHAVAGGGCYLVPAEWTDYLRRIGGRRFIITILYSLDGHCVYFLNKHYMFIVLCESPLNPTHTCASY